MIVVTLKDALQKHERRTGENLTYSELARRTGLSRATIEALGSRKKYNPTLQTIDKLCKALDCQINEVLHHVPDRE